MLPGFLMPGTAWVFVVVVLIIWITWSFANWIAYIMERSRTSTTPQPDERDAAQMREDSTTRKGKGSSVSSQPYSED